MHLVTVKKIDNVYFISWSVAVFILLADISNCTFNLFINNIVREPMIDDSLYMYVCVCTHIYFQKATFFLIYMKIVSKSFKSHLVFRFVAPLSHLCGHQNSR